MSKFALSHEDTIKLVLHFLDSHSFAKSRAALEQESGVRLVSYGKELDFFYDLILDGRFEDAEKLIFPLKQRSQHSYNRVISAVHTQKYLEALENSADPNLEELAKLLKGLEGICEPEEFNNLRYCLTLNSISEHPRFSGWSVYGGRARCFTKCLEELREIYPL